MSVSQLINKIIIEWAYRVNDGMPNPKNEKHIQQLQEVLSEMGLSNIKNDLVKNLLGEAENKFKNPVLNKTVRYKNTSGEDAEGVVGDMLRLAKDHPGRIAAEKMLPPEGSEERDSLNKDLGGEGQPEKPEDEKGKEGEDKKAGEEEKMKQAQAMFDPKVDTAMAARLDTEKETQAKLAADTEKQKQPETPANQKTNKELAKAAGFDDVGSWYNDLNKKAMSDDPEVSSQAQKDLDTYEKNKEKDSQATQTPEQPSEPETPKEEPKAEPEKAAEPETPKEDPKKSKNKKTTAREDYDEAEEKGPSKMFPGKVHLGGGYYGTDENEMPNEKIVNGKLIPISDIQKDFMKTTGLSVDQMGSIDAALKKQGVDIEKHINDQNWQEKLKKSALDYAKAVKDYEKTTGKSLNKKSQPKAAELKPNEKDPESKVKTFKGGTSGKEIKTIELEGGGFLFGTQHGDTKMADDIINQVKASVPKEKWKDIVFVGEGGATKNGELAFNDEMEYSAPKFKEMGAGVDTWDGDALDVHKPESDLYKSQEEQTGLSQAKIKAGNWASMIGQGEGTDTMSPNTFLDDEGKEFLQQSAKEAGFPEIENWDEPTEQDKDTLYRLSFPEDNGDKETGVNTVQVAFNKARDLNLIKKQKELAASGKIPVVMAGEGHADLVDTMMRDKKDEPAAKTGPEGGPDAEPPANEPDRPDTTPKDGEAETPAKPEAPKAGPPPMPKLPPKVEPKKGEEPKAAEPKAEPETPSAEKPKDKKEKEDIKDEEPGKEATSSSGKKIYSVGGGYYSDKPNGPAKYVRTENIVDLAFAGILIEETFALFEKTISATLANGEKITVQELPPRAVKKATQRARAAAQAKKAEKPAQQTQPAKGEEPKKKPDVVIPGEKPGTIVKKSDGKPDVVLPGKEKPKAKTPPPPPPPPPKKSEKPPIGEPQGEYKPDPNLKPEKDKEGNVPNTDIPVENEEKPNPGFVRKVSTKMDDFYLDVLKEEGRAQEAVIEQMKKEGKLPEDFKAVNPRDMGFGFKHPALKDNPDVQKELADRIKKENKPPHWDLCKVSIPGTNKFCDDNIGIPREKMPQLGGKPKPGSMGDKKAKKIADQNVRKKMGLPEEGEIPSEKQKEYDDLFAREKTDHVNVEKEFEEYLASEGIKVSEPIAVPASSLKATQNELVGEQVVGMVAALEEDPNNPFITAPIMVTRDGYVIDGHHRWATVQAYNMKHCPPNGPKPCIEMKVRVVDEDIDTHIPRANKFADDYGIEKMSGKAKGEPSSPTSAPRPFLQKVKDKIKKLNQEEKEFFNNGYYKPGSDARRSIGDTIKDKAAGAWKAIKKGFKHEVEEFKTAGKGIGKFFKGEKLDEHETKALKGVAIKVVTTALVGAAFGGLAHGAAAFAKHVAIEFVPHVVGETILKGAGRAAVFADGDGDAEMEANLQKFMEMVADGVANMNISAKQMDSMLDSYNQKKEKQMKSESLIEELINEITLEANPIKKADDVLNQMVKYKDEKGGDHEVKVATALKYKNSQNKGQLQAYNAAVGLLKKAGVSGKELGDEKPQQIKGAGLGFRKTGEKDLETPTKKSKKGETDSTQTIAKQKEVTKALYKDGKGGLLQGSTTSQQALDNGYVEGASWVAPGNAGSNFNENMSNEGVKILEKYPDLDEETLARVLYERTKNTKLGLQQKDVSIGSENKIGIPSDIENKEIYRNCVVVARSAKSKASRATMGADRATQEGKFGKKRTKQVFGGTKEDLARCEQVISKAPKVFIYDAETDSVYEMPKDVMLNWVKSSGGGENAADTATLTVDEKGNVIYDGWSDKKTLKDIQGNSTLVDDYTKSEERLSNLVTSGQVDKKTADKAKLLLLKDKQTIKEIEAGLKDISIQQSTHFLSLKPKDLDTLGDAAAKSSETKKHFANFKKSVDDVLKGKAKSSKKTNAIREGILPRNENETDEQYLARFNKMASRNPKLSNGNYFKIMSSVGKAGMLSGDDRKVIERTANAEKAKYKASKKPLPAGLDTDLALSELRKKSLGIQTETFKNLNKLVGKSSTGKTKKLGDLLAFDDAKGLLHLDKIDSPKNEKDYHQILKRNTQLAMEGIAVPPKTIKECLGVGNTKELEDSFELSFVERYTYDKDNVRVTGKVVYVYAINKEGKKEEIAQKVYRPKQGPTAPTANTVTWSSGMQKCFDSKK